MSQQKVLRIIVNDVCQRIDFDILLLVYSVKHLVAAGLNTSLIDLYYKASRPLRSSKGRFSQCHENQKCSEVKQILVSLVPTCKKHILFHHIVGLIKQ